MRYTIAIVALFAFCINASAQFYEKKVLTEKDGLLNDNSYSLYQDSTSGVIFVAHPMGISRIYGRHIETVTISEYNTDDEVYPFEEINGSIYFHHFKILNDGYLKEEFPEGHTINQITFTELESDSLHETEKAFRDSRGHFWMNLENEDGSYSLLKIDKKDSTFLNQQFEHKVYFESFFESAYKTGKRAKLFEEDNQGNIWTISKENELIKFNKGVDIEFSGLTIENFSDIYVANDGRVIVSSFATRQSPNGICVFKEGKLLEFIETETAVSLIPGPKGVVHYLDDRKLYQINGKQEKMIYEGSYLYDVKFDSLGNTYIWSINDEYINIIFKLNENGLDTILKSSDYFTSMLVSEEGIVWLASNIGIVQLKPSNLKFESYPFLKADNPASFYYEGNNKHGFEFYASLPFLAYNKEKSLTIDAELFDAFITKDGHFYGQFMNAGFDIDDLVESFYTIDINGNVKEVSKDGLDEYDFRIGNDYYGDIYNDQFYLNSIEGVYKYSGNGFTKYAVPFEINENQKVELAMGSSYFQIFNLVSGYLNDKTKIIDTSLIFNYKTTKFEEIDWGIDSLFISRYYGGKGENFMAKIFKKDKVLSRYNGESHLIDIPTSTLNDSIVKSIYSQRPWLNDPIVDKYNNYYYPASIHGLLAFYPRENKFVQLTKLDGLLGNEIEHLFFNKDSTEIYLLSYEGLQAVDLASIKKGKISKAHSWLRNEGIKNIVNHQWKGDSTLILHKEKGFVTLNLAQKEIQEPSIVMEGLKVFNKEISWKEYTEEWQEDGIYSYPIHFDLPYDMNHLTFLFQGVDHFSSSDLKYTYQLVGLDKAPISRAFSSVTYQNLEPGTYNFQVSVVNDSGTTSKQIEIPFRILKPYYQEAWFIILCILSFGFLLYGFYRWRVRALKRKELILKRMVKEKTIALEEEKNLALEQKDIIEMKNQEITDSISYSKRLQDSILPALEDIEAALPKSFVTFLPKDIVSGDFYWFEKTDDTIFIACADCTGHGVPGAMVSLVCANALNRCVNEFKIYDPAKILDTARKLIVRTFAKSGHNVKDGMDISLCSIKGNKMIYAGAYNPAWIIRQKDLEVPQKDRIRTLEVEKDHHLIEIKADKQPVAHFDDMTDFEQIEMDLYEGDALYLFSDGFVDQFGGGIGKKFKAPNFRKLLLSIHSMGMKDQQAEIEKTFVKWKGELEQIDDVCVIGVRL